MGNIDDGKSSRIVCLKSIGVVYKQSHIILLDRICSNWHGSIFEISKQAVQPCMAFTHVFGVTVCLLGNWPI